MIVYIYARRKKGFFSVCLFQMNLTATSLYVMIKLDNEKGQTLQTCEVKVLSVSDKSDSPTIVCNDNIYFREN